jgi:hypothetical protein
MINKKIANNILKNHIKRSLNFPKAFVNINPKFVKKNNATIAKRDFSVQMLEKTEDDLIT